MSARVVLWREGDVAAFETRTGEAQHRCRDERAGKPVALQREPTFGPGPSLQSRPAQSPSIDDHEGRETSPAPAPERLLFRRSAVTYPRLDCAAVDAVRFVVDQAGCSSCAERVRNALADVATVYEIEIDQAADAALVSLSASSVSEESVNEALRKASVGVGHQYRVQPGSWRNYT